MNRLKTSLTVLLTIVLFNSSWAQEIKMPEKPMGSVEMAALFVPGTIIMAAEQMPEEHYTFRPTPEVRSFGELIAHIAEANFEMTAIAKGEDTPVEKVATTKKEAIQALKESFEYYTTARNDITVQRKAMLVKFMGQDHPAGNVLDFTVFHDLQHYGNIIVYMRLKGLVPPSSQEGNPGN